MQELINKKNSQILEHLLYLETTDYKAIRTAEGYELESEIKVERESRREAIRTLEVEVKELERELEREKAEMEFDFQDQ